MFLKIDRGKRDTHFYIMQGYRVKGKGTTTKVYMNLGTATQIKKQYGCEDAEAWARQKLEEVNADINSAKSAVMVPFNPTRNIDKGKWRSVHCGHLILLPLYDKLELKAFSEEVTKRHRFKFNFDDILCKLVMGRILFPDSKRSTHAVLKDFVEGIDFSLDDIYNFLSVLAKEITPLQKAIYEATRRKLSRRTGLIYYDCTNYYFEIEKEDELRRYGRSKEHRPNPIVQMGMFMDADGLPLAFCINPGNTNEQQTLRPLEEMLANEFNLSEFVICTDAGLASIDNRSYNTTEGRNYIVTQSIPSLPGTLREWALRKDGWKRLGDGTDRTYDISELDLVTERDKNHLYYRDRWFIHDRSGHKDYEERLIVTFSPKYALYQRQLRQQHILKASEMIRRNSLKSRQTQQDPRRLITTTHCTDDGEVARISTMGLDMQTVEKEKELDGLGCIATRLDDDIFTILRANGFRYEIEHLFRVTKTDFEARPVHLQRQDRIKAHFAICFVALLIVKIFQKQLNQDMPKENHYSVEQIIDALSQMDYLRIHGAGYIPAYSATELRTKCCRLSNILIDKEIVATRQMKKYCKC